MRRYCWIHSILQENCNRSVYHPRNRIPSASTQPANQRMTENNTCNKVCEWLWTYVCTRKLWIRYMGSNAWIFFKLQLVQNLQCLNFCKSWWIRNIAIIWCTKNNIFFRWYIIDTDNCWYYQMFYTRWTPQAELNRQDLIKNVSVLGSFCWFNYFKEIHYLLIISNVIKKSKPCRSVLYDILFGCTLAKTMHCSSDCVKSPAILVINYIAHNTLSRQSIWLIILATEFLIAW